MFRRNKKTDEVVLPRPVAMVLEGLEELAEAYHEARSDSSPEHALGVALGTVFDEADCDEILAFIKGDRSERLVTMTLGHLEEQHQLKEAMDRQLKLLNES